MKRSTRALLVLVITTAVGVNLALWGGHVLWRDRALRDLSPILAQVDTLEARISEDNTWISRNERLAQGYGRHRDYADRLELRAQRTRAHNVLVETYNGRVRSLYRRFYFAPVPAPIPPLLHVVAPTI